MDTKNEEKKEDCPLCEARPIAMALGAAHSACAGIQDPTKKSSCMAWADGINPEKIKSAREIWIGLINNAGIDEANLSALAFNQGYKDAIIILVGDRLRAGETPEQIGIKLMNAYKQALAEKTV